MSHKNPTLDGMPRTDETVETGPSDDARSGLQDIIVIDSDSDEPGISSCTLSSDTLGKLIDDYVLLYPIPNMKIDGIDLTASVKEFSERCLNSLPLNLMATDFKNCYFYNSNQRLEEAKALV
jgi:hypothetical protein